MYLPTFTYRPTWAQRNHHDHQGTDHKGGIHPNSILYQSENWTLTSKERQMLTTTEMRCLRKAAGKTRMDKIRNEEIRRRVNMQPAEQTANMNKIRLWSHIKRMAPTAPQSKAQFVIHPERRRPRGRPRNRWDDDVPRWYRAILRYSFCRGRDILDIHPSITMSILLVEHSCCTYMEAFTYVFQCVINIFL